MRFDHFKILVPFDFSEAADKALQQAVMLKEEFPIHVDLFHVIDSEKDQKEAETKLMEVAKPLVAQKVSSGIVVEKGGVLETINAVAGRGFYDLMVIGTHGPRGLTQNLLGADILKLLKENPCASIVVQKTSAPVDQFKKILLPVGSHEDYEGLAEAVKLIAQASGAEVLLYTINRPGEEPADELIVNKENTIRLLKGSDIHYREIAEDVSVYSFGFAKQTLLYAENNGIDLIAIMPHASSEHSYFANADKERLLVNEKGIAVLCSAGV